MQSESDSGQSETILRDSLARDRTMLANERTFLAYVRTGLALGVTGISSWHFLDGTASRILGVFASAVGIFVVLFGATRFADMRKRIKNEAQNGS